MGKLAIVGTSKLTNYEWANVMDIIGNETLRSPRPIFITGDALGVDQAVRSHPRTRKDVVVFKADIQQWAPENCTGFKQRNLNIVNECDELICITTKPKDQECYHCGMKHQRTGGCWTMRQAEKQGKPTRLYVV